jgi:uroporphyrin-III C-methyltransferase/precorrin-2 dehydrogenase/sirohydrochlorin ferrochelatase
MNTRGQISLVGAGPGDPALLTRKAVVRLRRADLVLYDALVDERVLALARRAQKFFVGKRAGCHALSQRAIHTLMIRAARRGRRVVRLKGGDPFVFGRGGEEAMALGAAGVAYDIVPGITSAIAAPALAGIPVTHRGLASAFMVASGHDLDAFTTAVSGLKPNVVTIVILMGLGRSREIAQALISHGWSSATPAAIVADASKPEQHVWRGYLSQLAGRDGCAKASGFTNRQGPGTIVVGATAGLALTGVGASSGGDAAVSLQAGRSPRG